MVRELTRRESDLRDAAENHLAGYLKRRRNELADERQEETDRELEHLQAYRKSERARLEQFIEKYERQQEAGQDMDIAIKGQKHRLEHLEERTNRREENIRAKARVVSLEPELVGVCLSLPS
jgi:small-conductance mechanosensitive channel